MIATVPLLPVTKFIYDSNLKQRFYALSILSSLQRYNIHSFLKIGNCVSARKWEVCP